MTGVTADREDSSTLNGVYRVTGELVKYEIKNP
jgi:hypothetical protein